ncbi:MAG: tetratricopeptide repeat protein [Betaproteobacteria bacterium]
MEESNDKDFADAARSGKQRKVIMMVDMVESVRLMAEDESNVVRGWQQFTKRARAEVVPAHGGSLLRSLGDGLLLTFEDARRAVDASRQLQLVLDDINAKGLLAQPAAQPIFLRTGIHVGDFVTDDLDIYGHSVNLAARITNLGGPGETIVSAEIRDALTDGLDAEIEDLGDCYVKHIEEPVRAYRISSAGIEPNLPARRDYEMAAQTTIAVIPFDSRSDQADHLAIGDLIADGVIAQLSRTRELRVISRLSTTAFRGRNDGVQKMDTHLGAAYALSGSYAVSGTKLLVTAELVMVRTAEVVWIERIAGDIGDLLQERSELCNAITNACHRAILDTEAHGVLTQPLPTLASYSLLLGGITLMHRSGSREFLRAREVLQTLAERHSRHPLARVWLAEWYVLSATRGLSKDPKADAAIALDHTNRALDRDPQNGLALAMQGFVYCHLIKDVERAQAICEAAVQANKSEPLAWLFKAMIHAFDGDGERAYPAGLEAARLSPMDPLRYYFDSLMASIAISAGRYDDAIVSARRAIRANAIHTSSYRALALAQSLSGRIDEAKMTLQRLHALDPGFTVERFARNYPSRDRVPDYLAMLANAFRAVGVRES